MDRIDNQPSQLYANFDGEEPPSIETVSKGYEEDKQI